jgi:hypothetical protein
MRKGHTTIEVITIITIIGILFVLGFLGVKLFSSNMWAKSFGGTINVMLKPDTKLVQATWKESNLWYLTRPMRKGETAETSTLHEQSTMGMLEGQVFFIESETRAEK